MTPKTLTKKICFWMGTIGLVPLIFFAVASIVLGRQAFVESEKQHLAYVLKSRHIWLKEWLHFTELELHKASKSDCAQRRCAGDPHTESLPHQCKALQSLAQGHARYQSLAIVDEEGSIKAETTPDKSPAPSPSRLLMTLLAMSEDLVISPEYSFENGRFVVEMGHPAFNQANERVSYLVARLDLTNSLNRILGNANDLGVSGKMFLVDKNGVLLWHPDGATAPLGEVLSLSPDLLRGVSKRIHEYRNREGVHLLAVSAAIPEMQWTLVAELYEDEAFMLLYRAFFLGGLAGVASLLVFSVLALRSSRYLSKPLEELAQIAKNISQGRFRERVPQFVEKEAQEVSVALNHMLDRLEASHRFQVSSAALAAVGELSSSIVHEMRNPISSIKVNLQALSKKVRGDPLHEELAAIASEQTLRLEKILHDLLDYSKPLEPCLESATFSDLLAQTLHAVNAVIREKDVRVEINDHLGDATFRVDRELMLRALSNLIDNAVIWSPPGGLIRISGEPVPGERDWISIRVHDAGPGILECHRAKLFRPFFTTRKKGTGLGLANVKKIIEAHSGLVAAGNEPGGGAVFSLLLPGEGPDL